MTDVYANSMEICSKAAKGQSFAFPDVCWTPPPPPTGPLPIPYPNIVFARDITKGTKKVRNKKKECSIEDKSYFKKSIGDEPGCYSGGPIKGLLTRVNRGKGYFINWSPNVKFQKKSVDRHFDLVTHNHSSVKLGNTPPWPYISKMGPFWCDVCNAA
jgi:hypothetical protein